MQSYKKASTWDLLKSPKSEKSNPSGTQKIDLDASKFVIFQSTIVSSVSMEPSSSYLIDEESVPYVNSNGECWSNESLKNNYKSFIGAWGCLDHPDQPDKDNIGVILDAVLRRRWLNKELGKYVRYTDILVAINKKAKEGAVSKKVLDGSIEYMSMGCTVAYSFCSRCGHYIDYSSKSSTVKECSHLQFSKGKTYLDQNAKKRVVAELLGRGPNSVYFEEASLLTQKPAFQGAILSRIYPISTDIKSIQMDLPSEALQRNAVRKYILNENFY